MSVPTVGQMLSVIGIALVAVVVLIAGLSVLGDWLTRRAASAVNNTPALSQDSPVDFPATLPAQRAKAEPAHTEPAHIEPALVEPAHTEHRRQRAA